MERIEYLPLGSIVFLKGGIKELMIIGRGLQLQVKDAPVFVDYAAVQYPEGFISDKFAYFDHDKIAKVVSLGFSDDRDKIVVDNINDYLNKNSIKRLDFGE